MPHQQHALHKHAMMIGQQQALVLGCAVLLAMTGWVSVGVR